MTQLQTRMYTATKSSGILGSSGRPTLPRQRSVRVFAVDSNKLMKKPELSKPAKPEKKLFSEDQAQPAAAASTASTSAGVTIEYQRQRAKEMTKFFKEAKLEQQIVDAQTFGWTAKNEISNGRWVMFGLLVGMLTEYATGVDFINQIKLMVSYLGIVDLD